MSGTADRVNGGATERTDERRVGPAESTPWAEPTGRSRPDGPAEPNGSTEPEAATRGEATTGPAEGARGPRLNAAQRQVLDELGSVERPSFPIELRNELRHDLEEALRPILAEAEGPRFLSKHQLGLLHGCEARYVADQAQEFAWSVPAARGSVAHKAIELLVSHRGEPTPLELVESALERIEDDEKSLSGFIRQLDEGQRAELAGRANDFVATFTETFPPLSRRWVPVAEYSLRALLCDDGLTLRGKVDLTLGRARGQEAGKVLIDFKTGQPSHAHLEDLRFYALLETLKMGVPPRLLVNYHLDAGTPRNEAVTEELLWSAARRVVDAVAKMVELEGSEAREPTRTPGLNCRWCPVNGHCAEGKRHLEHSDEDDWLPG